MKHLSILTCLFLIPGCCFAQQSQTLDRAAEIRELRLELARLSARLEALEHADAYVSSAVPPAPVTPSPEPAVIPSVQPSTTEALWQGTSFGIGFDGYYGYNFNQPVGRVNLLRVYDISSNSFSINQASLLAERLPSPESRFGGRIDLQFGQATQTLQGSENNEQAPQVWRNLFQAYGSYLAPIGSGLQIDFGKFASALGIEGNYTKDQIAYSRSYTFNYLPYYHMGARLNYNLSPKLNLTYWLVNGAQQTEDFNGFKSQAFLLNYKPSAKLSWNLNYYFGQEQRDALSTNTPSSPSGTNITPAPNGRNHIFDTYATWNMTPKLTLAGEADLVISRVMANSAPEHTAIGAAYLRYSLPKEMALGSRFEYFDDRGSLFSGKSQALKEFTFVLDKKLAPGFLVKAELRRDFSNQRFFYTSTPALLAKHQQTATLGLIYWWGNKAGGW